MSPKKPKIFGARDESCRNAEARNFEPNLLWHTPVARLESASKKSYLVDILIIRYMTYHDGSEGMPREGGGGTLGYQ